MFSKRFKWNFETNQLAQRIEEKKRAHVKLFDLTESNPTRVGLNYPLAMSALAAPQALQYDPHPQGMRRTREAVALYYQSRHEAIDPEQIYLTASTSEAYSWLFKLLCDPGDAILVPQPSYPLFEFLATLEGITLHPYHLEYVHPRGWRIDMESIAQAITSQTKAVIVVNPNNPTGSYLKQHEFAQLETLCQAHKLALIVDEVFSDYALVPDDQRLTSFANSTVLTFVLNGLSKLLALPQMKLGWIALHGAKELRAAAATRLELIADTFLSVNTPVQWAAPHWLEARGEIQQEILARVRANLEFLAQTIPSSAGRLLQLEGGWSAILEVPRHASEEEMNLSLLVESNVLVHPGYFFEFTREAFFILSLLPKSEIFQPAVERIISSFEV